MARTGLAALLILLLSLPGLALATAPPRTAVFDFEFFNSSPMPNTPEEEARIKLLSQELRDQLEKSGKYTIVDIAPVAAEVAAGANIRQCNGCERDYAKKLGAKLAAYGWVQKVSNLILNINLVIEDVKTGKTLTLASVDIRGNTDESWSRGLKFLLDDRVFDK